MGSRRPELTEGERRVSRRSICPRRAAVFTPAGKAPQAPPREPSVRRCAVALAAPRTRSGSPSGVSINTVNESPGTTSAHSRTPSFQEDGIAPPPMVVADSFASTDFAKSGRQVQTNRGTILWKHSGLERPDTCRF